jgi:type IV pilus assembly protein PilY1
MTSETQAMGKTLRHFIKANTALYGVLLALAATPARPVEPIANGPLFLTVSVAPNVTVTLDDSGSMSRAWAPEANCDGGAGDINGCTKLTNRYEKASNRNLIFYNPKVTYPLPKKADGTTYTTSFTAAYRNGFNPTLGTVDLSRAYKPTASIHLRANTHSEAYMPHYYSTATPAQSDVRCAPSGGFVCQIRDPNGLISDAAGRWTATTTACPVSTSGNGFATARDLSCAGGWNTANNGSNIPAGVGMPAYYYVFDSTLTGCNNTVTNNACYRIVIVSATSGTGPAGPDERQNFANWYSFARTRNLATVTAASVAFADLSSSARVAWQSLNSCRNSVDTLVTNACTGWQGAPTVSNRIRPFDSAHRTRFYSWLTQLPTNGGTPLPQAMKRAGEYYKSTAENGPYDNDFARLNSPQHSCRRNYHIMMTDGIWNAAVDADKLDGDSTPLPASIQEGAETINDYVPIPPYRDSYSDTLADVAFTYWVTDLAGLQNNLLPIYNDRSGTFANRVWNPKNDPASWQHMVNYTIGLGLSGFLATTTPPLTYNGPYGGSYDKLVAGPPTGLAWPQPGTTGPDANVADLWHAALNSRGQFFSADNPTQLSTAFQSVLTAISGDTGSSASLSANSTAVQPGTTLIYQARFNKDWSGALIAYPVSATGVGAEVWDASKKIPSHDARKIFTFNDTTRAGTPFRQCSSLSSTQQDALNRNIAGVADGRCDDRLQWLRGDSKYEVRNKDPLGTFRDRLTTVMGDIINSDPAYIQNGDYGYSNLPLSTPGQSSYGTYLTSVANRVPMVYVGSNDGRLYGIRADQNNPASGAEQFSFIPAGVYGNLSRLTDPAYSHRFYVDGGITAGDAYLNGGWKSIVLAGLNAGGKSIFALDVTDPANFTEKNVMWEFEDKILPTDPESTTLGLTFSQPQIGLLEGGRWVAVFGNGYNSTSGGAYLYVVDLATGALIRKILASDVVGDESNGLSTPLLTDLYDKNGNKGSNRLMDTVYAGDLHGNLWKFDLSGTDPSSWTVANGAPLFTASVDDDADSGTPEVPQPITAQPKISAHVLGGKVVVFGTGRYITSTDPTNIEVQTLYGVRDNGQTTTATRANLQVQTITTQKTAFGSTVRAISGNEVDWTTKSGFYLDLVEPAAAPRGERVVSTAVVRSGRAIFTTIIPSTDPCVPGGTSFLMELNLATGGTFQKSILDVNLDGRIDAQDTKTSNDDTNTGDDDVVMGVQLTVGISKTPVILDLNPVPVNPDAKIDSDEDDDNDGDVDGDDKGEEIIPESDKFMKDFTGTAGGGIEGKQNGPPDPEALPGVRRRSWIQIR